MAKMHIRFNSIVTAFALSVALSGPLGAQSADLDQLFEDLSEATPDSMGRIEGQIQAAWERSGSPAMDLLLRRGKDALENGDLEAALDHFGALVDHAPEFAEGYNGRATAFYLTGRVGPAIEDIRTVLRLNPRHFGALRGLAIILEDIGRPEDALEVYREVLEIHPLAEAVNEAVERLEIDLEGRAL